MKLNHILDVILTWSSVLAYLNNHLMRVYQTGFALADGPHRPERLEGLDDRNFVIVTIEEVLALVSKYGDSRFEVFGKGHFCPSASESRV
ncbi:MAG TPA: hypothetical protein DCS60_04295 [Opitutae bacterium]|nr:hypothetical protein [Opitutae bacterium]